MNAPERFESEFEASFVEQRPGAADFVFNAEGAGSRAVEVEILPWAGSAWVGRFASPEPGIRALSALLATPSPTGLCVVERGCAFVGDVLEPTTFRPLRTGGPVVAAFAAVSENVLILMTPWTATGVGSGNMLWTSGRIAIDGFRVDELHDGWIAGVADPGGEPRPFALNLANGQIVGGAGIA